MQITVANIIQSYSNCSRKIRNLLNFLANINAKSAISALLQWCLYLVYFLASLISYEIFVKFSESDSIGMPLSPDDDD